MKPGIAQRLEKFNGMDKAKVEVYEGIMVVKANQKVDSFEVEGEDEN